MTAAPGYFRSRRMDPTQRDPDPGGEEPFKLPEDFEDDATVELVHKAQVGDVDALNDLFARYHSIMVEVARRRIGPRLRMKEEPDDLAQTTFREAARDFRKYRYQGHGSLLKWLIQILQNKIRDKAEFYSAGKRNVARETALEGDGADEERLPRADVPSPDLSVTRVVQRDERFEILRGALKQLPPEYRSAITLVFFEGLSLREAGVRMGDRSEDAVRMMLRRAESKLRSILRGTVEGADTSQF